MGSYAELHFGDFQVSAFKSAIPFEALLMFIQNDLSISEEETETEATDIRKTYKFVTTAAHAKHRLNNRGIELFTCRKLFDEFRSDEILQSEICIHKCAFCFADHILKIAHTKNPIDFDKYLQTLDRIYHDEACRSFPTSSEGWEHDPDVRCIAEGEHFDSEAITYFYDITYCIFIRCLLEVVPETTEITLDFTELIYGGYIKEQSLESLFDYYMQLVLRRIELDYKIYGFVIEDDPSLNVRLRKRISELNEDQFITHVLHPVLEQMKYERIRKVQFHGPKEFGSDIMPFRYVTPLGTLEYYSVQAKAVTIHGTSAKPGNAAELLSQATQAFAVSFVDDLDNERKRIDKFIIATNQDITTDARRFIEEAIEGKRKMIFLDIDRIVELVKKYRLLQHILFSNLE